MAISEQSVHSRAVAVYVADLVSRALGTTDADACYTSTKDADANVSGDAHAERTGKSTLALRVLEGALLAGEVARHNNIGMPHNSGHDCADEDIKHDFEDDEDDDDDIIVFEEASFGVDYDGFIAPGYSQHMPEFQATNSPFFGRVHVHVTDAMGAARNGMSYLGDRWEAFSYGLDDAAEKYTYQLEDFEGFVKVKMSTISGKTYATYKILDTTAAKCKQRIEVGADLVSGKARVLSQAAREKAGVVSLDTTAAKCKQRIEVGAGLVSGKARVLSQAARVKAGVLSSSKVVKKGRKGLNAARDKVHATLSSQTRFAWQSWKNSRSRGGA